MKTYPISSTLMTISCLTAILSLVACQPEGAAEQAGKKIDQAAANTSKELEQVKSTIDQKTETASEYIDDSVITAEIKQAIIADDVLKSAQIEVTTTNGVVKLSGNLASEQLIGRALGLVNRQKNVKSVQNDLRFSVDEAGK